MRAHWMTDLNEISPLSDDNKHVGQLQQDMALAEVMILPGYFWTGIMMI